MEKYQFFDKTADAKFQAFGNTQEESFRNAAEAMVSIMFNIQELEDSDELYEGIEDIWPDYPSNDDFYYDEETEEY